MRVIKYAYTRSQDHGRNQRHGTSCDVYNLQVHFHGQKDVVSEKRC
jgi:hypothetical protein